MIRIVFIDIDDVLLTARAHALPENAARIERMEAGGAYGLDLFGALPIAFDPCAVAWLNRIVAVAGAKIVVHSSWRGHFSDVQIRGHLLSQGIPAASLHSDLCCPGGPMTSKAEDICLWLQEHPGVDAWVAFDDDPNVAKGVKRLKLAGGEVVTVNPRCGLGPGDHARALRVFGVADLLPRKDSY